VGWVLDGPVLTVDVELPPGTSGQFAVPAGWAAEQPVPPPGSGRHSVVLRQVTT
jgi:alpha-L-rhamnosidase